MEASFKSLFPFRTLSEASAKFGAGDVAQPNDVLVKALSATLDSLDMIITNTLALERYITLTIPKMEDGNNFGVTVQLAALKQLKDDREKLEKVLEDISKYSQTRADAMEKCKLPSSSKTKTSSQSSSNGENKGGEKEGATSSKENKTEEKTVETANQLMEAPFRQQAVLSVDSLFYSKARNAFMSGLTCFMTAVDFMEKNKEKIAEPKGAQGGRSYTSMY